MKTGGDVDLYEPGLQAGVKEDVKAKQLIAGVPVNPSKHNVSSCDLSRVWMDVRHTLGLNITCCQRFVGKGRTCCSLR